MTKSVAKADRGEREGHGGEGPKPSVKKGTFQGVGTYIEGMTSKEGISPNKKSGSSSGGEQ